MTYDTRNLQYEFASSVSSAPKYTCTSTTPRSTCHHRRRTYVCLTYTLSASPRMNHVRNK